MHILSEISIQNYRSIKEASFLLNNYTPMVGYNNVGKSNIINAIVWLFKHCQLSTNDFNDPQKPVIVSGKIIGIDDSILSQLHVKHRRKILPYCKNESFSIQKTQLNPGDPKSSIKTEVFDPSEGKWIDNPTGIPQAISALFPEPIVIGAMEDANEDVSKSKTGTTIGKLISEIIKPIEEHHGEDIRIDLQRLKRRLEAEGEKRPSELIEFDKGANQIIRELFPGIKIQIHIPTPEITELFKTGTIRISEDSIIWREVNALGHGAQRSIQMALIRYLSEIKKRSEEAHSRTILFIDEPELYLHPHAIETVRLALRNLSNNGYQVIFTTHSPLMVQLEDIGETLVIRKQSDKGTASLKRLSDSIKENISERSSQSRTLFELSNSGQFLFSDKVIIAEGKTEQRLFPCIYKHITENTLRSSKIGLINVGGVCNIYKTLLILKNMGIITLAIADLDYAFRGAIQNKIYNKNDTDVVACRDICKNIHTHYHFDLAEDGFPKKTGDFQAKEGFEILANQYPEAQSHINNLHKKLLEKNIWIWKKGTFDRVLDIDSKNESAWSIYKDKIDQEGIKCIPYLDEVQAVIEHLANMPLYSS